MAAEQIPAQEPPTPKERFSTAKETTVLQARLILGGEALNPNNKALAKVESSQLVDVKTETYTLLSTASTFERDEHWQRKARENPALSEHYQQLSHWQDKLVSYVNDPQSQDKLGVLSKLQLGSGNDKINWLQFNSQEAAKIYNRYFGEESSTDVVVIKTASGEKLAIPSNVEKFVDDVLSSYTKDGRLNFDQLVNDLPRIKELANIFGGNSAQLIEAAILAKAKLASAEKKQELVTQVNEERRIKPEDASLTSRINWLNKKEERLLTWLNQFAQTQRKAITQPPPKPQTPIPRQEPGTEPSVEPKPSSPKQLKLQRGAKESSFPEDKVRLIGETGDQLRIVVDSEVLRKANENLLQASWQTGKFSERAGYFIGSVYYTPANERWVKILDYVPATMMKMTSGRFTVDPISLSMVDNRIDELRKQLRDNNVWLLGYAHTHPAGWEGEISDPDIDNFEKYYVYDNQFLYVFGAGQGPNTPIEIGDRLTDTHAFFSRKGAGQKFKSLSKHKGIYAYTPGVYRDISPPESTPPEPQAVFEPEKTYSLEKMFGAIKGDVDPTQKYFVAGVPQSISINRDDVDRLATSSQKPFFIIDSFDPKIMRAIRHVNEDVVPYAYDLGNNLRFKNGEAATDGDSSLFGLVAASADSPENQARLYKSVSTAILTLHAMKPDLLARWLMEQNKPQKNLQISSLNIFLQNDFLIKNGQPTLRPEEERLITGLVEGVSPQTDEVTVLTKLGEVWKERITDLNYSLQENKLQPYHLRWLEFLSHSVDVAQLIKMTQERKRPQPEIKILEAPAKDEELVKIIEETEKADEPLIIRIDRPLRPELIKIDIRPTLEQLAKQGDFERKIQIDPNTTMTDLIPLPRISTSDQQFFYFNIAQKTPDNRTEYSSCLVAKDTTGKITAVGHIDYQELQNKPSEGATSMSRINEIAQQIDPQKIPDHFRAVVDHFCPGGRGDVAVRIDNAFQGKGLGKYLWYLALAQAESDKIDQINILGDMTVGQDPLRPGQSFYKNLGAKVILYITEALTLDGSRGPLVGGEDVFSPTFLGPRQVETLRKLFQ